MMQTLLYLYGISDRSAHSLNLTALRLLKDLASFLCGSPIYISYTKHVKAQNNVWKREGDEYCPDLK